jgi:hypothetical protein
MIKLGSNKVVDFFDGRLDVLNLLRNPVRRREQKLSPEENLHTELLGLEHGSELHRSICGAGAKAKPGRKVGWGSTKLFAANQENDKT